MSSFPERLAGFTLFPMDRSSLSRAQERSLGLAPPRRMSSALRVVHWNAHQIAALVDAWDVVDLAQDRRGLRVSQVPALLG